MFLCWHYLAIVLLWGVGATGIVCASFAIPSVHAELVYLYCGSSKLQQMHRYFSLRPGKLHLLFRISHLLDLDAGGRSLFITSNDYISLIIMSMALRQRALMRNNKSSLPGLRSLQVVVWFLVRVDPPVKRRAGGLMSLWHLVTLLL